ncbi:T9SS type A sorting domain-containing protein [bacterium]|nr:T9SS type A sorting domain-containing protein [bacterium]
MKHKWTSAVVMLLALVFILGVSMSALAANKPGPRKLAKVATDNNEGVFDGNRIFSNLKNNGQLVFAKGGDSGMYWPGRASLKTINYASGMWVAGKVNGVAVTAAAEYESEWAAGKVLGNGEPADMYDPHYKLYKVNKSDMLDPQGNPDWMNWPVEDGAPWVDVDGNGAYEPLSGDMPDLLGGDQMIWYVMNDLDVAKHDNVFSSQPIGLECRVTIWGYNRPDEFGDMMFAKFQLFNKKSTTVDSCYLGIWADIDLGDAGDDFVGCDTTLSLGFSYNDGADAMYGDAAPAIGYDFFQGAIVASPGDTAKGWGTYFPDAKNLGMNTFAKYINGDDDYPDPETALECWNYMAGLRYDGSAFIHPITGEPMVPVLYAPDDPVAGTGWLDALDHPASDRRQLQSCGPFTLAPGDSQEIVTACIIAQGTDHLTSITRLKLADLKAQIAYDIDFALPPAPPVPNVEARGLDGKIVLTWDRSAESYFAVDVVDIDEYGDPTYYEFQGYNVYQLETDFGSGVETLIGTYDIDDLVQGIKDWEFVSSLGEIVERTVQYGSDSKIQRYIVVDKDVMRANQPLINNRPYYFAVTAYGYNPMGVPKALESPKSVITVYPQQPFGKRVQAVDGDTLEVTHLGDSKGEVRAIVVDPGAVTGHDYQVKFKVDGGVTFWDIIDATTGHVVLADESNQTDDGGYDVVDGVVVQVKGAEAGIDWGYQGVCPEGYEPYCLGWGFDGTRWISGNDLSAYYEHTGLFGGLLMGTDFWGVGASRYVSVKLEFITDPGPNNENWQKVYVCRRDLGYECVGEGWFPGKCWNVDVDPPEQLNLAIVEDDRLAPANNLWDMGWMADSLKYANDGAGGNREYIWMLDSPYDEAANPDLLAADWYDGSTVGLMYAIWPVPRGTQPYGAGDFNMYIYASKINSPADVFSYSTAGLGVQANNGFQKDDVKKINVFPNPYFGANVEEVEPLEHFVRFTHLPDEGATIRIYNLAGELVRTMEHDNGTQFEEWNLLNEYDIPVASGMYIVHVDCGDLGEKILKLALVMAEERLRQF